MVDLEDIFAGFVFGLLVGFLMTVLLFGLITNDIINGLREKAVESGIAEWKVVDSSDGKTEFTWIEKTKQTDKIKQTEKTNK